MKRIILTVALCLSVQISAMSVPFVHVHADAGHETDHHNGRTAHRHLASHDAPADHDRDNIAPHHRQPDDDGSPDVTAAEPAAEFLGSVTAAGATAVTVIAQPVSAFSVISPNPATGTIERKGPPIPTPPDISPPPLRGPPR